MMTKLFSFMLLDFATLVKKYNMRITGVIHVGAHHGEEYETYRDLGIKNIHFIEPCKAAYEILEMKMKDKPGVWTYKIGCGREIDYAIMHVERKNSGQSNSILKPAKHLQQYPEITFDETEEVFINPLDCLNGDRFSASIHADMMQRCNFLNMDVQGYEAEVLLGAKETLKHIDYVYTEVNRDEVYEGCARVEELDSLLSEFVRVETDWGGKTWGDALYVRRSLTLNPSPAGEGLARADGLVESVPGEFMPVAKITYPKNNKEIFERWYWMHTPVAAQGWTYLPVQWTAYYVNNDYGKSNLKPLQDYLNGLDRSKRYYTIVQYDDGILNDISHLDIRVFAMSGKRIDYPLPMVCSPQPFRFPQERRKYFMQFNGRNTHPIRERLHARMWQHDVHLSAKPHDIKEYCRLLAQSVFALCPRGYGQSSFRIAEALQFGAIPVYISDEFVIPHNRAFDEYGVLISAGEVDRVEQILRALPAAEIARKQHAIPRIYKDYYTFAGTKKLIDASL